MATDQDDEQVYNDLLTFLTSDRADLRDAAAKAVLEIHDR